MAASPEILGGQAVQARALLEGLRREGYHVDFIPIDPPFPRPLAASRRLPYARTILNQALYLPSLERLRAVDVVHVLSAAYWSFLLGPVPAMLAARAAGKRVILHYHSGELEDHLARWGVLVHPWLRLAHAIAVPSAYLADVFGRHGHRASVIPNVVDTSRFRWRERVPLLPRLLSVRNFEAHYRVEDVLRAFALVRRRHAGATLTVAGCGSEESHVRRLAASLNGGGGIRLVGPVTPEAMPALYDGGDVFLSAAVVDNQPVSILEAFAAGLAVVATGVGGVPAMLKHGRAGVPVPGRDPAAMAEAVLRLLDEPERARQHARCARDEVARYAWPRVREAWVALYAGDALDVGGGAAGRRREGQRLREGGADAA